jgi:glycosyltransferase involved in cell wall biosynthesis
MKVAIIGTHGYPYVYGGFETFAKELSERLVKQGVSVTIYCRKNNFKTFPKEVNGIRLVYLPTINTKIAAQLVHSFLSSIHAIFQKYDVVLVVNPANGPFGVLFKLFRIKSIINTDGLEWLRPKWKGIGAKYFFWASKVATKVYDEVVCDSVKMAEIYKNLFQAESSVIAYGANIRYSEQEELIKEWNIDKNEYYLIVGRLIPDNNSDLIVQEFERSKTNKKLVIVGDVPFSDSYANKIKNTKDERVIFTGYVLDQNKLAELYHHCFAYFHGHEFGGTNPAMLKAMAYGCAVIALDTPFSREMCDGDNHALYFNKIHGNLSALINSVESQQEHLLSLRKSSRQRIAENYTWEKITDQYLSLLNQLAKRK